MDNVVREPHPRPAVVVAVACYCGIVVALTQTMIIPLVPVLPRILSSSPADASWAITATLLAAAVTMPIAGRLGDMVGKRLMLLVSLSALVAGSVLCAVSSALEVVVAGRALQGLSMGAIALGISIMRDELPADRVGSAVAQVSATLGVGGAVGLPVAAVIAEKGSWHTLFWVAAVLALLGVVAVAVLVPESPVRTPARFDLLGAVGVAAGLLMLLVAITKGGDWGWGDRLTLGLVAGSLVVFLVWGAWELRTAAPLVDLRVSARPQVLFTNISSVAVGFAMYGMSLIPMQILMAPAQTGYGMGRSMIQAGLLLAPSGFVMYLFSSVGARLSAARGPRTSLATGIVVIGCGYVSALFLRDQPWEITLATVFIGAGIGIAYAAMPALIMGAVPITETAAANGLNALMRSMGTSLSSAVVSVVLAHEVVHLGPVTLPSSHGFTVALLVSIGAAGVALAFSLAIPRPRPAVPPRVDSEERTVVGAEARA
ncbi:MFS transporter [Nocardioides pocheonensis]|uniref:MFS transporter n=2 Tax=Nocardioides pocheonensis TaxID=661485 RepID=A0A3N0GR68_9ACTN|nr:MFS transporter [Nocardioides pocheonensis]